MTEAIEEGSSSPEFDYVLTFDNDNNNMEPSFSDSFEHKEPLQVDNNILDKQPQPQQTQQTQVELNTTQNSKYWECQACTFNENSSTDNKCFVCLTPRVHNINTQSNTTKESVIHKQVSSQTTIKRNNNKPIMAKNKSIKRKSITKKPIKKANVKPKKKEKRKSGYKFGDITLGAVNMGANVTNKAVDGISGLTKTISKKTFGKLGW